MYCVATFGLLHPVIVMVTKYQVISIFRKALTFECFWNFRLIDVELCIAVGIPCISSVEGGT